MKRAEEAVRITDGMGNLVNLHALATAEEESRITQVIYKGFMGDAMLGFALAPHFWADYDQQTGYEAQWKAHRDLGIITFKPGEEKALYSPAFQQEVGDAVMESYRAGMDAAQSRQLASQRLYFDLRQRVPRMTIKGVEVVRSRAVVRLPFSDNDLIDFSTQVPPGYLLHRHLIRRAFSQAFPELAKVPCTATDNLPLMTCARDVTLRAKHLVQWHLRNKGLGRLAGPERRPYRDYDGWFRTLLRSWVEDTLLSERALERGYFNPDGVRMILAEHMAGKKHTVGIGAMLSIEIWHRLFID
jgi:asparagine synthase (glutamine-hydrolysing)